MQVATVLACLHSMGFAHLDVKPANILLARSAQRCFKLADFGGVARLDGAFAIEEGDRQYLPAELLAGSHNNLPAADIFSLGITLYELATKASLPHDGEHYARLRRGQVAAPSSCSAALGSLILVRITSLYSFALQTTHYSIIMW